MNKLYGVLSILIGCSGVATETRVNTMGGVAGFLIDNSNVRLYPALITDYPNEIVGELRRPSLSCFIERGRLGVFGVGINSDSVQTIVNEAIRRAEFKRYLFAPPQFSVYYGRKIMSGVSFGLKLKGADNYYKDTEANCLQSIRIWGGSAGINRGFGKGSSVDLVGGIERYEFGSENESGRGEMVRYKDQGRYSLNGKIRVISRLSERSLFILGADYEKVNVSWLKERPYRIEEGLSSELREIYTGVNLTPSSGVTIVLGLVAGNKEGDTVRVDTSFTNIAWEVPKVVVSVESKLEDWFWVRIGANKSYRCIELKKVPQAEGSEPEKEELIEGPFNLALGWSIKFRDFELDVMSNELPFVTLSIGLSATYKFSF